MKTEELAFMKMNMALTKKQRIEWNKLQYEMHYLSDLLLDLQRMPYNEGLGVKEADRLKNLITAMPVFDLDGKGIMRWGNATEDF